MRLFNPKGSSGSSPARLPGSMGTAAGFFGITYQGSLNGLASVTLSIFNMVRFSTPRDKRP